MMSPSKTMMLLTWLIWPMSKSMISQQPSGLIKNLRALFQHVVQNSVRLVLRPLITLPTKCEFNHLFPRPSFQILTYEPRFVYGGSTGKTFDIQNAANPNFLDIFVLSLPSFQWFRTSTTNQIRRSYTTCKVIGNRQMVVIGGTNPSTGDDEWLSKDPFTNGIGIFDLTALEWTSRYDADAPAYQRPAVVQDYYASK